ncbi:MAG: LysE family translocator [Nocardioidaceae bacterium]
MLPTDHLLAFTLTAFVVIVIPGPSVLFVVSRALVLGRRGALTTVVGNSLGEYAQVMAVAFGVGAVVERSVVVFTVVKLCGATYLVYLGVQAIRHRARLTELLEGSAAPGGRLRTMREGFVVGVANPKSIVFFAAILPQFVDPAAGSLTLQLLTLGAVFLVVALVSDGIWACAAGSARDWLTRRPSRAGYLGGAGGVAMIGIGVRLAVTGRHD